MAGLLERIFVRAGKGEPSTAGELLQRTELTCYRASELVKKGLGLGPRATQMDVAFVSGVAKGR